MSQQKNGWQKALPFFWVLACLCLLSSQISPSPSPPIYQRGYLKEKLKHFQLEIEVYTLSEPQKQAQKLSQFLRQNLEQMGISAQSTGSEMERLHLKAPIAPVAISDRLFQNIEKIQSFSKRVAGIVDITAAPLYHLWGFDSLALSYQVPAPESLASALATVNYQNLELFPLTRSIYFKNAKLSLSLEYLMPGILLELAQTWLQQEKISMAAVQISNTGIFLGQPPGAQAWKIALPNPLKPQQTFQYLYLKDQALATLGGYQNFFEHQGLRYHFLLNPQTGQPARGILATSIINSRPLDALLLAHARHHLTVAKFKPLLDQYRPAYAFTLREENGAILPEELRN